MQDTWDQIHVLPAADVYGLLDTRPEGLNQTESEARLQRYGPNVLREVKGTPLYRKLLANFTHLMALLLWAGGIVALIARMPQLAVAIWMVNVINGAFSFWQEFRAEKATAALKALLAPYARVRRNGQEQRIPAQELAPGDIMLLAEGDRISADGRLVEAAELRVDQSTLTGESHPVRKTCDPAWQPDLARAEMPNLVFAGTAVVAGTGVAVAFATGMGTEFGKIAHLTQSVGDELSPLQREIDRVTQVVTILAVGVGVIFFAAAVALAGAPPAEAFIFGMGMIVAFVPEGLLPTVTLALAIGTQRMARRQALIKRLSAVETLGCTSVICTDKTGTLTQNEMTVRDLWLPGHHFTVTGAGYAPIGQVLEDSRPAAGSNPDAREDMRQLLLAAALCNNARLLAPNGEPPSPPGSAPAHWSILGDPTEAALLVAARKAGLDLEQEARRAPRVYEIPFESRRKRMSTIHTFSETAIAYVKGAPKEILALCSRARCEGQVRPLDGDLRAEIIQANDTYARNGLRLLAVATRELPAAPASRSSQYTAELVEQDLTFLGLVAMMDPPRVEVAEAIEKCHQAGIRIVMITGDYGLTAESIARRIGIVSGNGQPLRIITGVELDAWDDAALRQAVQGEVIFARVAPEHKLRVVSALQGLGHIVAVTGDGVNDAPALKKADIGVAMGLSGTDVAKEAADMILTDDNFASIVNAVEEGRAVYDNIKKFAAYIFTSNTPEAVPFVLFAFSAARIPLALNVMHVLAIDLGTDIVPALALSAEPPEPGIMERPPRNLQAHIITPGLLAKAYLWLGMIQSAAVMAAFYFLYWTNGYWGQWLDLPADGALYRAATAMALGAVVTTQIGNLFAQRTESRSFFRTNPFSNRLVWIGIASELILVVLIIYTPLFQNFIGTGAFPWQYWWFLFAWTPLLLLADELRKAIARRAERGRST